MKPLILGPCNMRVVARHLGVSFSGAENLPDVGGTNITNLALALIRRGIRFDLGTLSATAATDVECVVAGPVSLWVVRSRGARRLRDAYRVECRNLCDLITRSDCTVVNAHWTYEYGLAAIGSCRPQLVTVHDCPSEVLRLDGWRYLPHYLMARRVIRRARNLAAVSPYVQEYLRRCWCRDSLVVPNLLPSELPALAADAANGPIVMVAHAGRHKNVKTALVGFGEWRAASVSNRGIRLRLVGRDLGPSGSVCCWAARRGLDQGVEFVGALTHDEVLRETASARLLLSASLSESWSMDIAEAMAIGVPVLAAREAGGARFLLADECGWMMNGRTATGIATGIANAIASPVETRGRVARAQERIRALAATDVVVEAFRRALALAAGLRCDESFASSSHGN